NSLKVQIADAEAKAAEDAEFHKRHQERKRELSKGTGRKTSHDSLSPQTTLRNQRDSFLDDPKKGFESHREFLSVVIKAGERGGYTDDPRLKSLAAGADEHSGVSDP